MRPALEPADDLLLDLVSRPACGTDLPCERDGNGAGFTHEETRQRIRPAPLNERADARVEVRGSEQRRRRSLPDGDFNRVADAYRRADRLSPAEIACKNISLVRRRCAELLGDILGDVHYV